MCGFAGFYSKDEIDYSKVLQKITSAINHRGPDDTKYYLNKEQNLFVGFKRLSIIDLSNNGMQPINSFKNKYTIFFNGEIYNYKKIKDILFSINKSIFYKSKTDTEILVNSFESLGIDKTLELIEGQFAIALYDNEKFELNLIRDKFGEKPLYYGNVNNSFLFASELKSFFNFPNFNNEISRKGLDLYSRFLSVPYPMTIFENIYKVEPSQIVNVKFKNKNYLIDFSSNVLRRKYWNINQSVIFSKNKDNFPNPEEIIEDNLRQSIELQSYADVPIACLLSGGVDSSLICALYQTQTFQNINTFTVGFDDIQYDEARYANKIAKYLNTNHQQIILDKSKGLEIISNLSQIYCEPFADSSQIPTYLVSKEISKFYKVALSGDGGDEIFGGYNRYIWLKKLWKTINIFPKSIRKLIFNLLSKLKADNLNLLFLLLKKITFHFIDIKFGGQKLLRMSSRLSKVDNIDELFMYFISEWTFEDRLLLKYEYENQIMFNYDYIKQLNIQEKMMLHDTKNYLPNDILMKTDIASMSNSLELRSPFLNTKLFESAWSLPIEKKIYSNKGKVILNNILGNYLPRELFSRSKQGFSVPIDHWLRTSLYKWAEEILFDYDNSNNYFNNNILLNRWNDHQSGKANWGQSLWTIIIFNQWHQNLKK